MDCSSLVRRSAAYLFQVLNTNGLSLNMWNQKCVKMTFRRARWEGAQRYGQSARVIRIEGRLPTGKKDPRTRYVVHCSLNTSSKNIPLLGPILPSIEGMPGCSLSRYVVDLSTHLSFANLFCNLCRSLSVHWRNLPHPVSEIDGTTIVDNGSELWRLVSRRWEGCIVEKRRVLFYRALDLGC